MIALAGLNAIRGLEVAPASLDDAFMALTSGSDGRSGSGTDSGSDSGSDNRRGGGSDTDLETVR